MNPPSPRQPHLCSFESRRHQEMRQLIERQGGLATVAPSMREVPLEENSAVFHFAEELFARRVDVIVFMTGVGARAVLDVLETRHPRDSLFEAMQQCLTVVRGPKPLAVLREWNVRVDYRVPEPNTWRELLAVLGENLDVTGKTVAVQEYGEPNEELYEELQNRQAQVLRVPVYRWAFPEDTGPLFAAIESTIAGQFDALLFTSANQVTNVFQAAEQLGQKTDWLQAAQKCLIASIGPTASEKIRSAGLPVHVEASPPKMGPLVRSALSEAQRRLAKETGETDASDSE